MNSSNSAGATIAALAGVVFAILLFLSVAVVDPLREATDQELLAWWGDSSELKNLMASMYARLLALPFLVIFIVHLRGRLSAAGGESSWLGALTLFAGLFAAGLALSGVLRGVVAQAVEIGDEPLPGLDTLRFATEVSYQLYGMVAIPAAGLAVAAASGAMLRTRTFARWLGWLGVVAAALLVLASVLLMGAWATPVLIIWTLATSFELWRTRDVAVEAARPLGVAASAS